MDWKQARQGDVFFERISKIPEKLKKVKRTAGSKIVLAEGEKTGHAHVIEQTEKVDVWFEGDKLYLKVGEEVSVTHEEHGKVDLPPGNYRVSKQKDVFPDNTTSRFIGD